MKSSCIFFRFLYVCLILQVVTIIFFLPGIAYSSGNPGESANLPEGISKDWWTAVQENLRKYEYNVTWQDKTYLPNAKSAYQAANRSHNLRTYFTPQGFQTIPRDSREPGWIWGLSLKSYGFKNNVKPVKPANPSHFSLPPSHFPLLTSHSFPISLGKPDRMVCE